MPTLVFAPGSTVPQGGDGTGTHTDYTTDPPTVTAVTGLPIPEPEPVDPMATLLTKLADAQSLEEVRTAAAEAQGAI